MQTPHGKLLVIFTDPPILSTRSVISEIPLCFDRSADENDYRYEGEKDTFLFCLNNKGSPLSVEDNNENEIEPDRNMIL